MNIPSQCANAVGLSREHKDIVQQLLSNWQSHYAQNVLLNDYYRSRSILKDLGIAVPDHLKDLEVACGWGYKTVEVMRDHVVFDGFTCDDGDLDDLLYRASLRNSLDTRVGKAVGSALEYCFSMWVVTADERGRARISCYPPTLSTGLWDDVTETMEAGMFVVRFKRQNGKITQTPDWVDVLLPDCLIRLQEVSNGKWQASYEPHSMGCVPMFPMPYNPDAGRPFGNSRISPEVRWLIDCAIRANVNEEIAAAFSASTQKYLLGTDEDSFENVDKWSAFIGSIFNVDMTKDGTVPEFGQLTQPSMQPLSEHFNNLCKRMSAATGIHVGQFGIMTDNPTSAEAIYAENEPLILKCRSFIKEAKNALRRVCTATIATELGTSYDDALGYSDISVHFLNPAMPTLSQQTDSSIKISSVCKEFPYTPTFWRLNGMDDDEYRNVKNEIRQVQAQQVVNAAVAGTGLELNNQSEATIDIQSAV